jgi:hypothetical protein
MGCPAASVKNSMTNFQVHGEMQYFTALEIPPIESPITAEAGLKK